MNGKDPEAGYRRGKIPRDTRYNGHLLWPLNFITNQKKGFYLGVRNVQYLGSLAEGILTWMLKPQKYH